jgi:hypothetical protein
MVSIILLNDDQSEVMYLKEMSKNQSITSSAVKLYRRCQTSFIRRTMISFAKTTLFQTGTKSFFFLGKSFLTTQFWEKLLKI